jgi:hypothetical protein
MRSPIDSARLILLTELESLGLPVFHNFLLAGRTASSELTRVLFNAIKNYSDAVSYPAKFETVAKVFTVLESLPLGSDSSPIMDSLVKYLPKIISSDIAERIRIAQVVKRLYEVRSAYVHHAPRKSF